MAGVVAAVLAAATFVQAWRVAWDDDKDYARYYAASTVFYAPSLSATAAPPSLDRLLRGAHGGDGGCALDGASDVPSCLRVGTLTTSGWDARVSSYNGAIYALSRSSGDMQNVSLNSATVHYLNAWRGLPARWSGIMDGTGISQGMGGVAEWDGAHVTTCDFSGRYAIDIRRDEHGGHGGFPRPVLPGTAVDDRGRVGLLLRYRTVVVIPVTMMIRFLNRSVNTAAGVIEVRGSSGKTALTYLPTVAAGTLPGPVYPESLVSTQLAQASWAAGRGSMNNGGFGYEPTDSAAQAGNAANYLLRSSSSGRLEWVTPLTLRNSTSQLFVAYAVSAADSAASGKLNPLSIYVLSPSDPREINVDNVEAEARNWLAQQEPGFISSGGRLLEFTPVGGNMWRAYGELNGRVVYLLDIDATGSVAPTLTSVSPLSSGVAGGVWRRVGWLDGGVREAAASLTASQLAFCLRSFADELAGRAGQRSGAVGTGTGG